MDDENHGWLLFYNREKWTNYPKFGHIIEKGMIIELDHISLIIATRKLWTRWWCGWTLKRFVFHLIFSLGKGTSLITENLPTEEEGIWWYCKLAKLWCWNNFVGPDNIENSIYEKFSTAYWSRLLWGTLSCISTSPYFLTCIVASDTASSFFWH